MVTIYKVIDATGNPVDVKADGAGFQGNIGIISAWTSIASHGHKIWIRSRHRSNRINEPEFEGQFKGVEISPKVEYIKNRKPEKPNQIQAITGATISSDAVVKNINNAVKKVLASFAKEEVLSKEDVSQEKAPQAGEKEDGGK